MSKFSEDIILGALINNDLDTLIKQLTLNPKWIEMPDQNGIYPIFLAAKNGSFEMVKYLVEYSRCSLNIEDNDNQTILHYASMSDSVELVDYLINYVDVDPFIANRFGKTAYDIAVQFNKENIIKYFEGSYGINNKDYYRNPILTGFHPDPSIVRVKDDYYMVTSTFIYFPSIPILHSKDLINWKIIGHAVSNPDYLDLTHFDDGRGIWAPDISYHNGRFYITATLRMNDSEEILRKQMVVHSDNPQGPYSKPTYIIEDGIDPSIFTDEDNKRYMLLNRGARIFEISEDGSEKLSEPRLIWYGSNKRAPEAPHLFKKDGYYYCMLAEGGTGMNHQISIARSRNILGPYEACPYNPILKQKNPKDPIQRSGHGKFVCDHEGNWWVVYLCGRRYDDKYSLLGRETCIDPVHWSADGWPMINNNKGPSSIQKKPGFSKEISNEPTYNHSGSLLQSNDWMFVRTPNFDRIIQDINNNYIRFYPDYLDLDNKLKKNIIVRRQKTFDFDCQFKLKPNYSSDGCQVGITAYYDTKTYLKFGIIQENRYFQIFSEEKIGDSSNINYFEKLEIDEFIYFRMKVKGLNRKFYYSLDGIDWSLATELENVYYLCDEGLSEGKRFTGAMLGVFGVASETNLDFSYDFISFEYLKEG